jgi:Domain of unknown function (DUF4410)
MFYKFLQCRRPGHHPAGRCVLVASILCLSACANANVASSTVSNKAVLNAAPTTIYVANFDLDGNDLQSQGLLARIENHRGLLGSMLPYSPLMMFSSRDDRARHLASLMDKSLIGDLKERGFDVEPLPAGSTVPTGGWLVEGEFLGVDEGSRVKRALIGFGAGHTSLAIRTHVINLSDRTDTESMLDMTTAARSGRMPGSVLGFNPATAAAGFVLAGLDSDTDVKNTAVKIADEIVRKLLPNQQDTRSVSPMMQKIHDL